MPAVDTVRRFSNRVENYVKYRPGYPTAVYDTLRQYANLTADSRIADIGSGTGILTQLLLEHGHMVVGVEPNKEMREASQQLLAEFEGFTAVHATAEATTLPDHSLDLITAGQAFHWFNHAQARPEFQRVLKPGGWVGLVWNQRRVADRPSMQAYEALMYQYSEQYEELNQANSYPEIEPFFGQPPLTFTFDNIQLFDFDGLRGRFLSSSYAPTPGHPLYEAAMADLQGVFEQWGENGRFPFIYITRLFLGQFH